MPSDLEARRQWDAYREAVRAGAHGTSTEHAPWYVVPGDHKSVGAAVARLLVATLRELDPSSHRRRPSLDGISVI